MTVLGLDVGGANLKAAHTSGVAASTPFPLWKNPDGLADALRDLLFGMPTAGCLAVTMTGELCDCFPSKRAGVEAILDAVESVAGSTPIWVWRTPGEFADLYAARLVPSQTAAANWLALATFAGRFAPRGAALLVDVGSTTTDVVPLTSGRPTPLGWTDPERLLCRELVYTGVRRTPVCALLGEQVAAELFATTADVYMLLGDLGEDPGDLATADGRPATRAMAEARIARMLCADLESSTADERHDLAERAASRQLTIVREALTQVAGRSARPVETVIVSGSGEFLAERAARKFSDTPPQVVSLSQELGPAISEAACAYAVAVLAAEAVS